MDQVPHDAEYKRARLSSFANRTLLLAAVALLVGVFAVQVSTLSAIRSQQVATAPKIDETKSAAQSAAASAASSAGALALLNDCLKPGGACFARNQAGTAHILSEVTVIVEYVVLCRPSVLSANDPPANDLPALNACVETLKKEHGLG